jgi:hypothetical protein
MRKKDIDLPVHLRNGAQLPKSLEDIQKELSQPIRYKVVVYSIDSFATYWRLVHLYFISVVSTDPSNVRRFMEARGTTPGTGFDGLGRAISDLVVFSEYLPMSKMLEFNKLLSDLVLQFPTNYLMKTGHNLVQYTPDRFRESIVLTSISRR